MSTEEQSSIAQPPGEDVPAWRPGLLIYGVAAFLLIGLLVLLVSLTSPSTTVKRTEPSAVKPEEDIGPAIQETLRQGADLAACKSVIDRVNRWLADHPEQLPAAADAEALKQLRVSEGEIQAANNPRFTPLDAHYLELTLLLAEAARALDVDKLRPPQRAQAAFDWVCRQVRLREQPGDPFPAHQVLRRGWGTSLERAVVFASLVEQLGMKGCFIDCPVLPAGGRRFWLAGALADDQVYLFEPRIGVPLRTATGEIATLQQVRQQPDLVNQLDLGGKQTYDVTAEQAAGAVAQPTGFLTALAPRMRFLQDQLARPVRLAGDAGQLVKDFQPLAGKELMLWNFTRVLQIYCSPEQGGVDRPDKQGMSRQRRFELSLIDGSVFPRELAVMPQDTYLGQRIYDAFERPFLNFYFHERSPRELMLRGRLDEATAGFVDTGERMNVLRARLDNQKDLKAEVQQWLQAAGTADLELARARDKAATDAALQRLEQHWKISEPVQILLLAGAGSALAGQADYCLALAKHEQAERAQLHSPTEAAVAWRIAAERWQKHRADYPSTYADARLHHARALAMLGQADEALALLENPPAGLDHWNKHAHLMRARSLRQEKR